MYTGEPQRGLAFTVGLAGSFGLFYFGADAALGGSALSFPAVFAGAAGIVVFHLWNIIDAAQVAK